MDVDRRQLRKEIIDGMQHAYHLKLNGIKYLPPFAATLDCSLVNLVLTIIMTINNNY